MLARNRIVLLLDHLVGHGARVLLGDVVEAGVGRRHELDLDGDRFGHCLKPRKRELGTGQTGPGFERQPTGSRPKVKVFRPYRPMIWAINPRRSGFSAAAGPDFRAASVPRIPSGTGRAAAAPAPPC